MTAEQNIPARGTPAANLRVDIEAVSTDGTRPASDTVTIEEPLEIRLSHETGAGRVEQSISITMRTPGNDEELAVGFLAGETIIAGAKDITRGGALRAAEP